MASQGVANIGTYGTVSIGGTAAVVKAAKPLRKSILIQNVHASNDLYVGFDDDVTTANGVKIVAGGSVEINDYNGVVYGIASAASTDVRYLEVGG